MLLRVIIVLVFPATLLLAADDALPSRFEKEVSEICPKGWTISGSNNVIAIRREDDVWVMGYVARPAISSTMPRNEFFQRFGHKIQYEIRLRFVRSEEHTSELQS